MKHAFLTLDMQARTVATAEPDTAPVGSRRLQSKARTRRKVMDSARDLFIERGYETATIRDIANHAGLSTGAVFANFSDKHELFEAVLMEDCNAVLDAMKQVASTDLSLQNKLLQMFLQGYEHHLPQLPLMQAYMSQAWIRPLLVRNDGKESSVRMINLITEVLLKAQKDGDLIGCAEPRLVADVLWDVYLANYRRAAFDGWGVEELSSRLTGQIELVLAGASRR